VAFEGFIHEAAAAQDDAVAEIAAATAQGLSLWEGALKLAVEMSQADNQLII